MLPISLGKFKLLIVNEIKCLDKYFDNIMIKVRECGMKNIRKERERAGKEEGRERGRRKREKEGGRRKEKKKNKSKPQKEGKKEKKSPKDRKRIQSGSKRGNLKD